MWWKMMGCIIGCFIGKSESPNIPLWGAFFKGKKEGACQKFENTERLLLLGDFIALNPFCAALETRSLKTIFTLQYRYSFLAYAATCRLNHSGLFELLCRTPAAPAIRSSELTSDLPLFLRAFSFSRKKSIACG